MSSTISEYDLGGEGDLFKAPEPIIEEPILRIDPMTAAISMMSCTDHVMPTQDALESLQNDQIFGEVSYECKKNILGSKSTETQLSEAMDIRPPTMVSEMQTDEKLIDPDSAFQKSVSSGCLSSMDWINASTMRPSFLDFSEMDFGAAYGMRRAFSEGDIKALGNGNTSQIHPSIQRPPVIGSCSSEDRLQKLSRYRNKKSRRNFGRKIKYACRKALADSQPRIRGRFAKTEETELLKRH